MTEGRPDCTVHQSLKLFSKKFSNFESIFSTADGLHQQIFVRRLLYYQKKFQFGEPFLRNDAGEVTTSFRNFGG